nr:MauE/DoxX family redox-associated membrane protein [Pedobacter schmidteae]
MDLQKFSVQLGQSPLLTDYANFITWFIPAIEILISLFLINKRTLLFGLYGSFGLMLMFTVYIFFILNFAERIPCSCGGILEKMGWTEHLIFNIFFVLLALLAIILQTKSDDIELKSDRGLRYFIAIKAGDAENL